MIISKFAKSCLWSLLLFCSCSEKKLNYTQQEATVAKQNLTQIVTVAGKLEAAKIASILAPYDGYIRKIYVEVGQKIKKNDPVISLSTHLDDNTPLFPMRAPFSGRVTDIAIKEGQYVTGQGQNSQTLVQIEDTSQFELEVEVPELDLPKLEIGQIAKIKLASAPGEEIPGRIKYISLSPKEIQNKRWGDDSQSRYRVAIDILKQSPEYKSGLSATVDIQSAEKKSVLALPGEFLTEYQGAEAVRLKDGTYKKIKVGLRTDNAFEILSGVNEGEAVIMDDFANAR